jgi:hypothetical protein
VGYASHFTDESIPKDENQTSVPAEVAVVAVRAPESNSSETAEVSKIGNSRLSSHH